MSKRIAVFLDLQGTLGGAGSGDIMSFAFYPFTAAAIRLLNDAGLLAIVVTNQSHIAKGYFTWEDYGRRMEQLKRELAAQGAYLDADYCCPHASNDRCTCRKPLPGLVHRAQEDFDLDLSGCYLVGDAGACDMVLARSIGCKAILVRTGLGEGSLGEYRHLWAGIEPDFVARDVLEAARWIAEDTKRP
ncbi:MAG: HAD-IIIA family hydrolase [Firmicutes bacterium]|nr:HAD-IIIA family hydrolase [Bacillota bacterium]